jgi:septum formation protein
MGLTFDVEVSDIDESQWPNETPIRYVQRLALAKARAVAAMIGSDNAVVIGADTCVVRDTDILGKPRNANDARTMLQSLSGRSHVVYTGVAITYRDRSATAVEPTTVTFNVLSNETIDWYIATGEAFDKAGSYGMQAYGGVFVERIDGSPSNVIGLPLHVVPKLATEIGVDLNTFRH